jgi:hypothetical protein
MHLLQTSALSSSPIVFGGAGVVVTFVTTRVAFDVVVVAVVVAVVVVVVTVVVVDMPLVTFRMNSSQRVSMFIISSYSKLEMLVPL